MESMTNPAPKKRRSVALLAAGLLAGSAAAGTLVVSAANAAPADATLTASSQGYDSSQGRSGGGGPHDGRHVQDGSSKPVRGDEKAVPAAVAAKLKAAALKAVPGGTVTRVETDAGDAAYEAHGTKSDGTRVTVKFDKSFAVVGVEDHMGKGDPRTGGHEQGGHRSSDGGRSGEGASA